MPAQPCTQAAGSPASLVFKALRRFAAVRRRSGRALPPRAVVSAHFCFAHRRARQVASFIQGRMQGVSFPQSPCNPRPIPAGGSPFVGDQRPPSRLNRRSGRRPVPAQIGSGRPDNTNTCRHVCAPSFLWPRPSNATLALCCCLGTATFKNFSIF